MWDIFAQHISTQRQGQAGFAFPPFAKIDNLGEAGARVSELPFMNDETGVRLVVFDGIEYLVKRNDDVLEITEVKPQSEVSARHASRHRDHITAQPLAKIDIFFECWRFSDNERSVTISHARAAGHERILVTDVRIRVDRDRGNMKFTAEGAFI